MVPKLLLLLFWKNEPLLCVPPVTVKLLPLMVRAWLPQLVSPAKMRLLDVPPLTLAAALALTVTELIPSTPPKMLGSVLVTLTWIVLELPLYGVVIVAVAPDTLSLT